MSKNRFHPNKETILIIFTGLAAAILILVNITAIGFALLQVYRPDGEEAQANTLDVKTIDQAFKITGD